MKNLRKYGKPPFNVAVIHGGPGAPREMAPVARELSTGWGVLEPFQTAASLEGQVQELYDVLKKNGALPITLISWSWGAMLSFIFTARCSSMVKKLILVGSGPFEKKYAAEIMKTRLSRLNEDEKIEVLKLVETLNNPAVEDKNNLMSRLGKLIFKADSYDPLPYKSEILEFQYHIFQSVWKDAEEFRASGGLLNLGRQIQCPVVAIHGDYDPHPYQGVLEPLSRVIKDFRFILLENCGHYLWIERMARDRFYDIIKKEL
ncbi:MAG: alpha/beta hydrolase, partial [Bacteroidetes bacterium]|nr:alpha/beta hydrolase [Bacteroidota bacterium]